MLGGINQRQRHLAAARGHLNPRFDQPGGGHLREARANMAAGIPRDVKRPALERLAGQMQPGLDMIRVKRQCTMQTVLGLRISQRQLGQRAPEPRIGSLGVRINGASIGVKRARLVTRGTGQMAALQPGAQAGVSSGQQRCGLIEQTLLAGFGREPEADIVILRRQTMRLSEIRQRQRPELHQPGDMAEPQPCSAIGRSGIAQCLGEGGRLLLPPLPGQFPGQFKQHIRVIRCGISRGDEITEGRRAISLPARQMPLSHQHINRMGMQWPQCLQNPHGLGVAPQFDQQLGLIQTQREILRPHLHHIEQPGQRLRRVLLAARHLIQRHHGAAGRRLLGQRRLTHRLRLHPSSQGGQRLGAVHHHIRPAGARGDHRIDQVQHHRMITGGACLLEAVAQNIGAVRGQHAHRWHSSPHRAPDRRILPAVNPRPDCGHAVA